MNYAYKNKIDVIYSSKQFHVCKEPDVTWNITVIQNRGSHKNKYSKNK